MTQEQSVGIVPYHTQKNSTQYLIIKHTRGNHWDFPKGKIEPHESFKECALRELQEETGLSGTIQDTFSYTYTYTYLTEKGIAIDKSVHFYVAAIHDTKVTLSHEHTEYAWASYQEALQKLTHENSKNLLAAAHDFIEKNK